MQLKCNHKLHGIIDEKRGTIEVACGSRRCGSEAGVTVLHTFAINSGELIATQRYKKPQKPQTS